MARNLATPRMPVVQAPPAHPRRLDKGRPPLSLKAARSVARSQAYRAAADVPSTPRADKADLANFKAWCGERHIDPMPSTPEIVGANLANAGRRCGAGWPRSRGPVASPTTAGYPPRR